MSALNALASHLPWVLIMFEYEKDMHGFASVSSKLARLAMLFAPALLFCVSFSVGSEARRGEAQEEAEVAPEVIEVAPPTEPSEEESEAVGAGEGEAEEGPQRVTVGLYLHHVPELDLHSSSYLADFYLWFRWTGDDDPSTTFELVNLVEGWDVMREALYVDDDGALAPETLPDGSHYQCFHVQGRFGHPFDVHAYPFDEQDVVIALEDGERLIDELVYEVDPASHAVHPTLELPGWSIGTPDPQVVESRYATNFGDIRNDPSGDAYSQFRYRLHVRRPVMGAFVKTIVPIGVVMLITLLMLLIDPKYFEGRLGLGITSLISAVALQLTAGADLPSTGYLVLLDHIYNAAYVVIFVAILESVISVRLADGGDAQRAKRLDVASLVVLTLTFFGTVGVLFVMR